MNTHDLQALKPLLPVPEAWVRLGLPGRPAKECRSPFRQEKDPSFSIYAENQRWHDHATGEGGDVIDFIARACQLDKSEAARRFLAMVGAANPSHPALPPGTAGKHVPDLGARAGGRERFVEDKPGLFLPLLRRFTVAEIEAVARSRRLRPDAVSIAQSHGTLFHHQLFHQPCWVLTDSDRRIAEARRIDAQPFPAKGGSLGQRKAHTLPGSSKSWPVGVAVLRKLPAFRAIMLVEGGPDYLAALHLLCAEQVWDVLPVAMLGRSTGNHIAPAALGLLQGRRVRIYPHADADGGGELAARRWAGQLIGHGCNVDFGLLQEERCHDGSPAKDLNDLIHAPETQRPELIP